jgi:hypothetical protein
MELDMVAYSSLLLSKNCKTSSDAIPISIDRIKKVII